MKIIAAVLGVILITAGWASAQTRSIRGRLGALTAVPRPRGIMISPLSSAAAPALKAALGAGLQALPVPLIPALNEAVPVPSPAAVPGSFISAAAGFEALNGEIKRIDEVPMGQAHDLGVQVEAVMTGESSSPSSPVGSPHPRRRSMSNSDRLVERAVAPKGEPGWIEQPYYVSAMEPGDGTYAFLAGVADGFPLMIAWRYLEWSVAPFIAGVFIVDLTVNAFRALWRFKNADNHVLSRAKVIAPLTVGWMGVLSGAMAAVMAMEGIAPGAGLGILAAAVAANVIANARIFAHPDFVVMTRLAQPADRALRRPRRVERYDISQADALVGKSTVRR